MRISDLSSDVCSSDLTVLSAGLDSLCNCTSNSLGQLDHSAKQTFQNMASRFFLEWITRGSKLSRAEASARLLFLLHVTHRYNPPVCKPRQLGSASCGKRVCHYV